MISTLEFSQSIETAPIDSHSGDIVIAAYPTESIRFAIYTPGFLRHSDGFPGGRIAYTLLTMTRTWIVPGDIRSRPTMDIEEAATKIIGAGDELTNTKTTIYRLLMGLPPVLASVDMGVAA